MDFESDLTLKEWAKDKPLSILQLDPADRAVLRIADERDAIQKKTFTKWVNKHLKKANRHVDDLFTDLQDGLNLISLLEVLSGEHLHREKGRMRFHALQNVELVLNFLRYKKIKLVNIRPEDIVDGNPKLTLGLIWTIILHFQISDIVLSQREENVSPKEVLLKWAKKSTARYPEVRVSDFTSSWRDGMAFNALIHRNRPDLFEWRTVKSKTVRDRLEHAFYNAEKVGVTRLLDPEDVDTHEIDEKSIITYISSLYDVFPEPPAKHPLFDNESQTLTQEYREVASSLHLWIREHTSIFSERTLPATLNDLVKASQESSRFKTYELPSKQPERQRLTHLYTELQKIYESTGQVDIEPELHIDVLERNYQKLLSIHAERDQQLQDEIKKFERLDRLADRLSRDCKRVDSRLDDVETRVSEESKRLERLHPLDAKRNAESLESEMRSIEETINSLFQDLNILKTVGHSASSSLDRKVNKLHQKWVALRSSLHSKLIARLASVSFPVVEERTVTRQTRTVLETRLVDTNHHFRSLQQAIEWCKAKIKLINESELGNDLAGVKIELAHHEREHKEIDRFKTTVEQCAAAKTQFTGEEHALYLQHLNNLHKVYSELLTTSNKRMSDLESLLDYLQSLQNQLQWLSDKEAVEVARDWSDPNINLMSVQHYHDNLMSELEKREVSVRSVLERGNSLVLQNHPAGKTISRWTELLKEAWSRLLQFSLACEIHTEATRKYQEYTKDLREAEAWLQSRDELLNTVYSASEFSLDEGERLLKGMQEMREELNKKAPLFAELTARAAKIPPIRQRRLPVTRPIQVTAVCNYTSDKVYIEKEDTWLLHDNSALTQWRVSSLSSRGEDTNVPGVVFFIPPPGKELLESAERLNRAFESTTQLWQKKHMRLRQNMIFATIRVVRSWDLAQFISMGADQRNAIRRALNEDADKLLSEGDPTDPQLRRLRREMDEVNRLFEELERRARQEDEQKAALREFTETSNRIQLSLDEYERTLNSRILNSIARDPHTLERLILQHHDFEKDLKSFTPEIENIQTLYNALARKSHQHTLKVESLLQQWNTIWNYSHLYTERLKCVEIVLASLDEARNVVSELEIKLASFGELPSELESLKDLQDDLVRLQNAIAARQPVVDQLIDDATNTRRVVVRSRDRTSEREHGDLDRLDEDVNSVTRRWNDLCANLVDRLRSCDAAGQLLDNFGQSYQTEIKFIDESYKQLNDLPPVSHAKHHIEPTKVLFTSIVERTQPLEQVNIDGGRFIREAKIYGVTLRRYADEVTKLNPSFERPEYESVQISNVEEKLDNINQRFLTLVTVMQDRIRQMAALTGDEDLQEFVRTMKPAQLRTFRTVFSIAETTKEITNRWLPDEADMGNQINGRETSTSDLLSLKGIKDPSTGRILSVSEAIRERILDVRNGTVRLPSGESIPLASAAEYVDPVIIKKLLSHHSGSTLLEKIQNEIFSAENPQAMEEKYKLCDDSLRQLLEWMSEVEDRLARQEPASENLDGIRDQLNHLKLIKEELESQQRIVQSCLDDVRNVITNGQEYLSRDELMTLERSAKSLKTRYDRSNSTCDRLLRRLQSAYEELSKFRTEANTFAEWLGKTKRILNEKEKNLKNDNVTELLNDIISHQADLRFITMASQKFSDESKEFLNNVNEYRNTLASRPGLVEPYPSELKKYVAELTREYKELSSRIKDLSDKISGLGGRQREYKLALERVRTWMQNAEPRANKILSEPLAADPHSLDEQLARAKSINAEFQGQGRLFDHLKQSLELLLRSIEGQASRSEMHELAQPVEELTSKYEMISNSIAKRIENLDNALAQSQGVEQSLENVVSWLSNAENNIKSLTRPASLNKARLEEQVRSVRGPLTEIVAYRGTIENVVVLARNLVSSSTNPRLATRIETKVKDVLSRYEKLLERSTKLSENFNEVTAALDEFNQHANEIETWLQESMDGLAVGGAGAIDVVSVERDAKREPIERVLREGRNLLARKDVTDTSQLRDRMKNIETQWRDLNMLLDEKVRLSKMRAEQSLAYDKLRDHIIAWLNSFEGKIARLEPVALQMELIKKQTEDLKPLVKEHREFAPTIDRLFDLGTSLESVERPESPTRRRSSVSPVKRLSSIGRKSSQEMTSPTPTKIYVTSPMSPVSSGFGSRRSSQEVYHGEDYTGVQQEVAELNNRYSSLGVKLAERSAELDSVREELRKSLENLRSLDTFLERTSRAMPRDGLCANRDEAEKTNKLVKSLLEEMYEKQSLLDSTKNTINELLKRKNGADLKKQLDDVCAKWKNLYDACKNRIEILDSLKDFYDTHDHLSTWLGAKERMIGALGPISSDPRMVQSQVEQVQVLREELRAMRPQLSHLEMITGTLVQKTKWTPLEAKLKNISDRWTSLAQKLDERASNLGAAVDSSREFDSGLNRLRETLNNISDQIDAAANEKDHEQHLRKIQSCERQLEGARQLLAEAEAAGEELCKVLTDAASRAEIQAKLAAVNKQYNALQAKLDRRKAEIENFLKDAREFDATLAKTSGWINDELGSLSDRLLISAHKDILQQQYDFHEPIYKDVINREHQVVMLFDKASSSKRNLENLRSAWDKLKKEISDRHARLSTSLQHCKKFYANLDSFVPWLATSEARLESLRPESFSRRDLDKHLRDLTSFRNDIWKKSGEFEHLRSTGETFVASCDIDKDIVLQEIASAKNRWDRLNNDLLLKTSTLEELGRRLADASDRLRSLTHSVQRCEDRLGSHDSISTQSDPATIARLNALRDEVQSLRKPHEQLRGLCSELDDQVSQVSNGRTSGLKDEVDGLADRLDDLSSRLQDRCDRAQLAARAAQNYYDKVKNLTVDLTNLEDEFHQMKPPGRDLKVLKAQQDELGMFNNKLNRAGDEVSTIQALSENLDSEGARQQAENIAKRLSSLESASRRREESLENALDKLHDFLNKAKTADELLNRALDDYKKLKPVGSEPDTIRSQQDESASLRANIVDPAGSAVESALSSGQILVQTASPGVNTAQVERECDRISQKWNDLKEKMTDRDKRLNVGLLQSGKFQEALEGLSKWLADMEDLVANQKPPSADFKVVKAQLQEQKFLKKMLLDRQGSINSLFVMGREVASNCGPSEGNAIERQLKNLSDRFEDLNSKADSRMNALEKAMNIARIFQDKITSLSDWLFKTEKKIKDMHTVPTDEEKIQNKIREHESLHSEIMRRKSEFNEVTDIAANLASLVSEDDATLVADQVQEAIDRYSKLVNDSENVSHILESARQKLRHLVVTYQQLQGWMENMESRLARFKVLAVHTEQLYAQMEDLADLSEEISNQQNNVDSTIDSGHELMRSISSDEAIQLKDKLDSLQRRYNDLTTRGAELLKQAQEALPLVQQFHNSHNKLVDWMHSAETTLQNAEPREESIHALEMDIQEFRPVLETVNQLGPQLCAIGPGEGAATIEGLVTRDNRRFDAISEQVQRKAERLQLCKQRSLEVLSDVDSLLEWFREVEAQLREAEPPNGDPQVIRLQLKEHKALNDDIASQKGRVRDVLDTAKKVLRESPQYEDNSVMRDKMVDLRETMDNVWKASGDRLNLLELALGLAQHFETSHSELAAWLDEKTAEAKNLRPSSLRPQALMQDQVVTQRLLQSITEHKPLMDKLNKTGESLIKIVSYEEGVKIQDVLDNDNARYNELRNLLKQRQEALEKALQESSEFADKLEGMLRALSNAADEMNSAEPVSAHPPKIRQQIKENQGLIDDIGKREEAFEAVKKAAGDVIAKSPNDPAVKDIKKKLEKLQQLWKEVNDATKSRNKSLSQALEVAAKFWAALESVMTTLAEIERTLMEQEPPALKPELVRRQGEALGLVKNEIDSAKPRVEDVRKTGQSLMALCGDADKTEVRKNIEDLDSAWDTVTTLFARREENLLDAMERAMEFHETLRALKEFLQDAERRFAALGPLGEDIGTIRNQMKEVKDLKASLDPMMIKVESLNRQAAELTERSTADQAMGLKESLTSVNNRWDELHRGIAERYRQLENALLRLGQFQTALSELLTWIANTEKTLDNEMSVVAVDPHLLEVQLAKLKVLMNDMSAHQNSVDTLNDAGRQIVEENPTDDKTQDRLKDLNKKWKNLITKASEKQSELEEALRQGQRFSAEIQDLLAYLGEVDSVIASSKPVGGLPETASEQLERFMIVYNELEETRPRIESAISHGNDLIRKNHDSSSYTQNNLKTLKSRWDNVISRANDKKIKLEIALKEAVEFHDALQAFVNWLTSAEKTLSSLKPVSRVLETILNQIEDHKNFQKEVGVHRETMLNLDKKGNHLKYFSQKQDVILIKNLLISVQHRWEKVVSKSAERTRSLDHGYKEAKDFHDSWSNLINFLKETDQKLDDIETSNDPVKLRQKLTKHREIQKSLTGKQIIYDATLRQGKNLKEKAPKSDENTLKMMLQELKDMWTSVNNKVLLKQRNLEESLLYCGQVKDALDALLDFLKKANKELADDVVHGDLDTVQGLIERHRSLEQDIQNRRSQIESLERSELLSEQISELSELWKKTNVLCQKKNVKLQSALKMAEELHKNVHNLLEFLSDSESKLRNWELSDDETELRVALQEHERFLDEIKDKERDKNMTIRLAEEILSKAHPDAVNTIKHWISIIQSRWEEITSWSRQKTERLKTHLRSLQDMDSLLEELLAYLGEKESNLISLEHQELPKTTVETNILIEEHQRFMESMAKRTTEIDTVIKAKTIKERKQSKKSGSTQEINEITRRQSLRSSREQLAERRMSRSSGKDYSDPTLPHFGPKFPTKGSKTPEPQFKCSRSRLLYDRWRSVWLMSWERQRRLRDHLLHLGELERLANFSWDEWRKRFLRFMNHKKSRLTDLFRKMDKNNDNLIPRDDFVNGIINTKFDTNRPEMGAVADMFDHNSEGYIDWKEFIAALRPDWEERQPSTEAEKIHDEVKRLVMLCTCRQKFRVFQVGEGKYRFGDSQKLRLVRILRSTVMVRVGGGWQALEEFLVKNDPCRAKGRTNIELREQFILPEGVSQSMSAFKPKLSTEKKSSSPLSSAGPITKIREKSSKSVPMASSRGTPGSVDSLSDLDSPHTPGYMMPRKSSMRVPSSSTPGSLPGSRSNSRPQSRTNSKPPSRHASNLSLASSDDGTPSRIPRMSVPSRSSSSASGTQRKLTAPGALNGSKSPSGRSSTSKIPVFVGSTDVSHSTSSSGTPSGRTTPKSSR